MPPKVTTSSLDSGLSDLTRHTTSQRSVKSGASSRHKFASDDASDDDDDFNDKTRPSSNYIAATGPTLRAILPQIINEQNRKTFGTWQRQFDFTRTIIGYILGIHNFFRFPFLCYKYGGVFFIPYVIMMLLVGVPVAFMEFTIGQYYGVGSYVAFTHMSPILSGVSKLLTWSCVVNCWMYTVVLAWLRVYSNDATSCLKGWEVCEGTHYYNTPLCYTGALDDECNDVSMTEALGLDLQVVMNNEMLYYNFDCQTMKYYCETHGWVAIQGTKFCIDDHGKQHAIYERRLHATTEYLYGAVLGLQRYMETSRTQVLIKITLNLTKQEHVADLVREIYPLAEPSRIQVEMTQAVQNPKEAIRAYLTYLKTNVDPEKRKLYKVIKDSHVQKQYQEIYWQPNKLRLQEDKESSSFAEFRQLSMTTWVMIIVFLFEDLLKISFLSYVLNAVPFVILIYVTSIAVYFNHSGYGMEQIFALKTGFFTDLSQLDLWAEAVLQVIYTTGVGNGVLISLSTFNNLNHNYLTDLFCTMSLSVVTSACGVLVIFCSLGQYLKQYDIEVPFREFIKAESVSSVDFGMLSISILLTLISNYHITIILFFFMLTSFATDTAIRLVQSVIDTVMDSSVRFKPHATAVLVAVSVMGFLILVPMMKNGAFVLFVDFEYFAVRYMMPTVVLIEVGACLFIYKGSRILDHSEQMGVFYSYTFRVAMLFLMYLSFFVLLATVIINIKHHVTDRFNGVEHEALTEQFGWLFFLSPLLMVLLSVIKQLIVVPPARWHWLLVPLKRKDRKAKRALFRRIQGSTTREFTTEQDEIREAAMRWRKLESKLVLAMMEKRREEKAKEAERMAEKGDGNAPHGAHTAKKSTPLLVKLVKIAAAAKKEDDELFGGNAEGDHGKIITDGHVKMEHDEEEYDHDVGSPGEERKMDRERRLAFLHVKKNNCLSKFEAAFMGKALNSGEYYRPKRHAGGGKKTRLVTRQSVTGEKTMNLEDDDEDAHSDVSLISHDEEDGDEKLRESYLNALEYVERWPGRLDEDEIESEGSSFVDSDEDLDDAF